MDELHDDLRATADAIANDAERLAAIEEEKETLADDHPRLIELSREAREIARQLVPKTVAELELAEESGAG